MNDRGTKQIQRGGNGCLNYDGEDGREKRQRNGQGGYKGDKRGGVDFKLLSLDSRAADSGTGREVWIVGRV